ncbi:MAG TPA: glycosyltransferase family 4 protein [Terriglobales bacterium]|nr:glycosyltransferase family 4 protein [Terriglobales bacterium]
MTRRPAKITVFTPSFADESDSNAQNLTVKEVVCRLSPERFRIVMLHEGDTDQRISRLENVELLRWRRHGNSVRCITRLLCAPPDIYFFPREGPLDAAFLKLRRLLRLQTKVVTYVVSGGLYNGPPRRTLDRNVREADAVYGNCAYLSELVRQHWNVTTGTVYDGIDVRYFFPNSERDFNANKKLVVLFAGSLRPYKRPDLFVRSAARWPQVQFRIAGVGEQESNCRKLANELDCRNLTFLGHLTSTALGEQMRQADVFLFPSMIEGHPQVLGQAAACGLPAVAMNVYRPEFVVHGRTGFLANSEEDLGRNLDLLLNHADLRQRFSAAAVEHSRRFEWTQVTRCWEQAFEHVMATGNISYSGQPVFTQVEPR